MYNIISCYTDDDIYRPQAERLKDSLDSLGIDTSHINPFEDAGGWEKNCQHKAIFIREKLKELDSPVVWVDCDAIVLKEPTLFDDYEHDIGVFHPEFLEAEKKMKIVLSGTIYLRPSKDMFRMLDEWIELNETNFAWDQLNLRRVLYGHSMSFPYPLYDIGNLPLNYCSLKKHNGDDPVIQHIQISGDTIDHAIDIKGW